jgi:hypothetical protein
MTEYGNELLGSVKYMTELQTKLYVCSVMWNFCRECVQKHCEHYVVFVSGKY